MNSYKIKVTVIEWFIHIFIIFFAVFLAVFTAHLKKTPGASVEQAVIHILIVAGAVLDIFILYKKKIALVELDKYNLRYHNFRTALNITLTDITKIERTNNNPDVLTCYTTNGKTTIPLKIENSDDFLNKFVAIIEAINYRIEFNRDNLFNKNIAFNKHG